MYIYTHHAKYLLLSSNLSILAVSQVFSLCFLFLSVSGVLASRKDGVASRSFEWTMSPRSSPGLFPEYCSACARRIPVTIDMPHLRRCGPLQRDLLTELSGHFILAPDLCPPQDVLFDHRIEPEGFKPVTGDLCSFSCKGPRVEKEERHGLDELTAYMKASIYK